MQNVKNRKRNTKIQFSHQILQSNQWKKKQDTQTTDNHQISKRLTKINDVNKITTKIIPNNRQ